MGVQDAEKVIELSAILIGESQIRHNGSHGRCDGIRVPLYLILYAEVLQFP